MWTYRAKVVRVIDGDTVDVDVDLGFGIWQKNERVRIMGIDTPESRTRNKIEKKFGLASKQYFKDWVAKYDSVLVESTEKGKFGRILGELWTFDTNINEKMIERHHAVRYHGQSKKEIQEEHIKNRELVEL